MAIHVNTYGHMQLELLTMEILVLTVHVLQFQEEPLLLLFPIITTVNLEHWVVMIQGHTTHQTHCGTEQVVLLAITVVPSLTNHGSIIS